jgi:hypothetical protein
VDLREPAHGQFADPAAERLRVAARRAYEAGRLEGALLRGAAAFALALPGFLACGRGAWAALCLSGFALVVAAGRVRGGGFEQGVRAGAAAGIVPCLFPAALRLFRPDLCDFLFARGPWLCAILGVAAGIVLGLRARGAAGGAFWSGALVTLCLAAALGCIPAGEMGFAGLLLGVLSGGLPVLAARRASS